ncbi:tubulin-like doman-containing protein [Lentzea sp. NPDC059081]|uniref:tubulin-like doman-containing protein n=1 Tax=Lentzea sp. NPDC059081 TaxID=3346719 RepID=UPI003680DB7E
MLQPFLFVGVGGSGGDTLRFLHRELSQRLRRAGITRMPSGWQFVHIDTRVTEEYADGLPHSPNSDYVPLASRNVSYRRLVTAVNDRPSAVRAAFSGWRPDPDRVHVAIEEGAGQYRAIGRAVAIHRMQQINTSLALAVQRVEQADALASLDDVAAALLGERPGGTAPTPIVVVFSSLAGGTGSGIFLDVCDLLRGLDRTWTDNSVAVLYAPDVFRELRDDLRKGVQANALATVSEMLAGHWLADPGPDPVHVAAGAVFQDMRRSGPAHSFLVGMSNGQLTFHDQNDVFGVVARSMAAWATSPAIQQQFSSYVQSNWQQGADRADPLGLVKSSLDMPFSALGYASVTLGRDLFRLYSAQCLARASAERLLFGPTGKQADLDEAVRQREKEFGRSARGLTNATQKSLFDKLNPRRSEALAAERSEVLKTVGVVPREIGEWASVISTAVDNRVEGFLSRQRPILWRLAEAWANEVQGLLLKEIRESIVADGIVVTHLLVRSLIDDIVGTEVPSTHDLSIQDDQRAAEFVSEIVKALGSAPARGWFGGRKLFGPENERVVGGVNRGIEAAMGRGFDAEVRRLCAELLADFAENLLERLSGELATAVHQLREDSTPGSDGTPALTSQWPQGPAYPVPLALRPSRTRFLVDPVEDYPRVFTDLLCEASGEQLSGDAITAAVRAVLLTDRGADDTSTIKLLEQTSSWQPVAVRLWSGRQKVEQSAAFRVRASATDLLGRCDAWVWEVRGFSEYLRHTLSDALGDDQPDIVQQERLRRFVNGLEQAIAASAPLVRLDNGYTSRYLDPGAAAYRPLISPIPLKPGSQAYDQTKNLLMRHLRLDEDRVVAQFSTKGPSDVELTSFLSAPCHPIAFSSLTEPIQGDWQTRRGEPSKREGFARWRRARPLPRAVPLPFAERRALVRGWLLAHAVKTEIRIDEAGEQLHMRTRLTTPLTFKVFTTTPDVSDAFDTLAALLESMPLVLIEHLDRDPIALRSYQELLKLDGNRDQIVMGTEGALAALKEALVTLESEAERRLPAMVPADVERAWDLREDIFDALRVIREIVEGTG